MQNTTTNVRHVLFVDDDAQFLEIIKGLMTAFSEGLWDVSTADSAGSAFSVLQEKPVDLVVIDVQMDIIDGVQMLSLLNRGYPNVQKVALTGHSNEKYRAACLSNGAELFLQKPVNERGWENLFKALDVVARLKPADAVRGVLRPVGLQELVQMECISDSSCVLEISDAQTTGQVFVENGQIIHAQAGDTTGVDAFHQLVAWNGAQLSVKPFSEPPARSISGPWETVLMEATHKRHEAIHSREAVGHEVMDGTLPLDRMEGMSHARNGTDLGAPESLPLVASASQQSIRPAVEEFLICSSQGEVWHQWQCPHVDVWVNFFEFLSQRARRIEQSLPLGNFDRLEIQGDGTRAVVVISPDKVVMVHTRQEAMS